MIEDPAVEVVCSYLRINGYFTLTEFDVHQLAADGYRAVTDVDVIAVRLPSVDSPGRYEGERPHVESGIITSVDPDLSIAEDRLDVIFGEVKQGEARFNPGLHTPAALHAALRRVGGHFGDELDRIVDRLLDHAEFRNDTVRIRLVGFGSYGRVEEGTTISLGHTLGFIRTHVMRYGDVLKAMSVSDPIVAFLELAAKAGYQI